ncbi:hypothetical protein OQA88_4496 [Cercophora sp. LCS_1]
MSRPSLEFIDTHALELVECFWHRSGSTKDRLFNGDRATQLSHETFREYYHQQWNLIAGHGDGQYVATSSPKDLVVLIDQIREGKARQDIMAELSASTGAGEESCENSINLAARLLTMMKFGVVKHQAIPRRVLRWDEGDLDCFVKDYFDVTPALSFEHVRLPKAFNAWSIETIGGIQIGFTDNLADHLLLVEEDSKVLIFHHASFLESQAQSSIFPDGVVDETLRTLALLFSQSEFSSHRSRRNSKRDWFRNLLEKQEHCTIDPRLALCGNLQAEDRQIERFVFWRDRLVILKQAYDDATPRTLSQWWHDRRNGVQWYTFWVAVLVFLVTTFLGVVQCIEGALQVYKSYEAAS